MLLTFLLTELLMLALLMTHVLEMIIKMAVDDLPDAVRQAWDVVAQPLPAGANVDLSSSDSSSSYSSSNSSDSDVVVKQEPCSHEQFLMQVLHVQVLKLLKVSPETQEPL